MIARLRAIDLWLEKHRGLVILLAFVVLARIPTLFEPYWYGDEAIYLTIGQALNRGAVLYSDIVDHKTPIIYYLARVDNQLAFRFLLLGWMLVSTVLFHRLLSNFFAQNWLRWVALITFTLLTTSPLLEGNIPNGELFVLGFVLLALNFLMQTKFKAVFGKLNLTGQVVAQERWWLLGTGMTFGLALLTKVPALLDIALVGLLGWLWLAADWQQWRTNLKPLLVRGLWIGLGLLIMVALSAIYFGVKGAGTDYLRFGLLYNFHYANSWQLPAWWQRVVFSLPFKTLVLGMSILALPFLQFLRKREQVALGWLALSLFAILLSNRPYPHYFIQAIPAISLLVACLLQRLLNYRQRVNQAAAWVIGLALLLSVGVAVNLGLRPYPPFATYASWLSYITGRSSLDQYRASFGSLMTDNYQLADYLGKLGETRLFIWGTNPTLYALSQTQPVGRFTVSFHITDLKAYAETMGALQANPPNYIVIMDAERAPFPEFYQFLYQNYMPDMKYTSFSLWRRVTPSL